MALERGNLREATAHFERLIELLAAPLHGRHPEVLQALAYCHTLRGDLAAARPLLERAMRAARRNQDRVNSGAASGTLGLLEATAGNWEAAFESAERARRLGEATRQRAVWLEAMAELARIHAALGRNTASDHALEAAAAALERGPDQHRQALWHVAWARAWVSCRRGDWEGTARAAREAVARSRHPLERAKVEIVAIEALARSRAAANLAEGQDALAGRLAEVEGDLRTHEVRPALVDLARARLYLHLAGWQGGTPEVLLSEIAGQLAAMGAPARGGEIAAEFGGTALAHLPACQSTLAGLAAGAALPKHAVAHGSAASPAIVFDAELAGDRPRIITFGRLAVTRAGDREPLTRSDWGSRKARHILAYFLATDPDGRGLARDALWEAVWPDSDSLTLETTFRVTMTLLRRALGPAPGGARLLGFRDGLYHLDPKAVWCDANEFDRLLKLGLALERQGDTASARRAQHDAFDLYHGEFLGDLDEPWIEPCRERYRVQFLRLGVLLCTEALAARRVEEAEETAEKLVAAEPLAEEAHRQLITAYLATGRREAAARQLEHCRAILRSELGVEVSDITVALLLPGGSQRSEPTRSAASRLPLAGRD